MQDHQAESEANHTAISADAQKKLEDAKAIQEKADMALSQYTSDFEAWKVDHDQEVKSSHEEVVTRLREEIAAEKKIPEAVYN